MASKSVKGEEASRPVIGGFVRTARGIGRLVAVEDLDADIRYFRAPGRSPYVDVKLGLYEVAPGSLAAHTRAYIYDGRRWTIGRVDGQHPQDPHRYLIAFPNGQGEVLPTDAFDVRWDDPIDNPFDVLAAVGGDSPVVYDSRLGILDAWSTQRAAAAGVQGLVLASVQLHRHQLRVVRRVGADTTRRYILADEVGLGKTIEAGAIIWQVLQDKPNARVLVIAPDHLREQWAAELVDKFRIGDFPEAWVRIRSHARADSWPKEPVDLLVVDEAHHFTRSGTLGDPQRTLLKDIAHSADALLLLTATPVRSNEAGFLDLLHLIDPVNYKPDDVDEFTKRVELRDQLALTYQALVPSLDEFDLSLYADELRTRFPGDATLGQLLDVALSADDVRRPYEIRRVREHLSETYRLHHRLLRTRRSQEIGSQLSVRGRKRAVPFTLEVTDPSDQLRWELLDSIRSELAAAVEAGQLTQEKALTMFADVAGRASSLSSALITLHMSSTGDQTLAELAELAGDDARARWDALVEDIHGAHASVLDSLGEVISRVAVARGLQRVVLASAYTEPAACLAEEMTRRWGTDRVATHLRDRDDVTNNEDLARWRGEGACTLLVCDAGAEEGLNLQEADLLIHVDLPWDTFRVEQRIGRCDRHGPAGAGPIPSGVVVYGDNPYGLGWFEFVADGSGVFTESVSSLQYVLRDTERRVQEAVLTDGPDALAAGVDAQASVLAEERVRIVAHDSLDAIEEDTSEDVDQALLESDLSPLLTSALLAWLEGVGARTQRRYGGAVRVSRRPRPQIPFALELALAPHLETDHALDRKTAVSRALPILRAGHPFVDLVAAHLESTDRGVAFAMFRPAPGQWPPVLVLRTDFRVTFSAPAVLSDLAAHLSLAQWVSQTSLELAPPSIQTVISTPDGVEVTHPSLRAPYNKQRGDRNLSSRPELFEVLTDHLDWTATCAAALPHAEKILAGRTSIADAASARGALLARRIGQFADRDAARARVSLETDALQWAELTRVATAPLEVTAEVVGCGAIFVGDPRRLERRD